MKKNITVDAELFDDQNNIINNIVISLFNAFQSDIHLFEQHVQRKILQQFEVIYKDLSFITKYGSDKKFRRKCSQSPLESLTELASSTNLRIHLTELNVNIEKVFNVEIEIINYNFTRTNELNDYYLKKYIDGVFDYKII